MGSFTFHSKINQFTKLPETKQDETITFLAKEDTLSMEFDIKFDGCEQEISIAETIQFMVTRFDLLVRFAHGLIKFSKLARPELKEWFTEVVAAINYIKAQTAVPATEEETAKEE
jgi:hypothetical protein